MSTPVEKKEKSIVLTLLIVALILRLSFIFFSLIPPVISDAADYDKLAKNLVTHHTYSYYYPQPTAYVVPGYPLFLSVIYTIFGVSNYTSVRIIQAFLSTLTVLFTFLIAKEMFNKRLISLLAALLVALHIPQVHANVLLLNEVVTAFTTVIFFYTFLIFIKSGNRKHALYSGLLLGLCCMVRPTLFFFPAFVFVLYMLRRILQRDKKGFGAFALPLMKNYILLYLFALLIFSPWVIRNLVVFKKFILFSTESGMCFYSGTRYDYNKGNYHDFGEHTSEIAQMDEFAKNEFLLKVGLKTFLSEFKKDPAGYAGWYLRKIASLWEPYIIYYPDPIFKNNIIVKNQHRLLIMAGMTAVIFAICFPMPAMGLLIILFIYHTLLHVSLIAISRYTFPIMPLVMIAGSYGLSLLFDALKNILTGGIGQKVFTRVRLVVGLVLLLYVLMCLRDNFKQSSALFNLDVHPFFLSKAFGAIMRACIILYLGAILALVIKAKLVTRENKVVFFALLVFFFYISMLSGYQRLRILGIAQSFQVRLPTSATLRRQSYGPAFAAASAELAASATIEHVIDLPRWSKGYPDVRLLLSIFNSNNKPIDYDLEIFVNDALMRRFGRGDILSDSALSEIQISLPLKMADAGKALHVKIIYRSNAGGNYPILCGTAHVFRGVSLFNGQDKNLAPSPQAETGTYSIGLRLYGKSRWTNVYYWRGSRRKAAMVADAACSAL